MGGIKKNLTRYQQRQIKFLSSLVHLLKPSGTLTYSVCSTEPEENEMVIKEFLNKYPAFKIKNNYSTLCEPIKNLINTKGCLKTLPHKNKMDGFFCAVLQNH